MPNIKKEKCDEGDKVKVCVKERKCTETHRFPFLIQAYTC